MTITATRYHDISCGHRVYGHENKCSRLHGHNYRIHFTIASKDYRQMDPKQPGYGDHVLDSVGRVIDFSVIKTSLCQWLEDHWDHNFLVWDEDSISTALNVFAGVVFVPFNPTAENMAKYLVEYIGPLQLPGNVKLIRCTVEETRKCSASYEI